MNQPGDGRSTSRGPDRRAALKLFGAAGLGAAAYPLLSGVSANAATTAPITVNWANIARISKTTPTLQVVVNPLIERGSPIHDNVFSALKDLHADYVRFVPWFPYPRLGVAELEPPGNGQTSWDFSLIDPMVEDFEQATRGHSTILNFSTTPEWMWQQPWYIQDGELYTNGYFGVSNAGTSWTDYTFAVDVTPFQTGDAGGGATFAQAGLAVRSSDANSGYAIMVSNYPYTSSAAPGYIAFVKFQDGKPLSVQPTALPSAVTGGDTYHVTITVSGSTFTVTVNGTTVGTFTDFTYASGKVGFASYTTSAAYDNVKVTAPDGTVLLTDDFSGDLSQWKAPDFATPPADPSTIDFNYSAGNVLTVPVQTVADYYRRVVSWYTAGGFTDEYGNFHKSNHHYSFPYWEVLNELERQLSPQLYTQLYDAIVHEIHEVSPATKFVALALGDPTQLQYFSYFLNPANHQPGTPLDWISYHFYAVPGANDTPDTYGSDTFSQADAFLATVDKAESIRKQLAPHVRTDVDELGSILSSAATQADPAPIPDEYWNYSGCIYAYVFAGLALKGIDVVGESQLVGYPGQFPSVSMVDWNTGLPNARYRVLQLVMQEMPPGCGLVPLASGAQPDVFFGLGVRAKDRRKLLLVNKTNNNVQIQFNGLKGAVARIVDQTSAGRPIRSEILTADDFNLTGYAVAVITLPD